MTELQTVLLVNWLLLNYSSFFMVPFLKCNGLLHICNLIPVWQEVIEGTELLTFNLQIAIKALLIFFLITAKSAPYMALISQHPVFSICLSKTTLKQRDSDSRPPLSEVLLYWRCHFWWFSTQSTKTGFIVFLGRIYCILRIYSVFFPVFD